MDLVQRVAYLEKLVERLITGESGSVLKSGGAMTGALSIGDEPTEFESVPITVKQKTGNMTHEFAKTRVIHNELSTNRAPRITGLQLHARGPSDRRSDVRA
jgi:hypothetical protein